MKGAVCLLALCVVFAVVVAQPQPKWPPAWPSQFTITQIGYWPSQGNAETYSTWWYDYVNLRHRFDHQTIINTPLNTMPNSSSEIWIGYNLYMYNWDKHTCIHQDLGIGIPTPNWFIGNTSTLGELQYLNHNNSYYYTVQTLTPGPYYKEYGPYNYYALHHNGTPFRMAGPGTALGVVVNDWYDLITGEPDPSLFDLPEYPVCVTVGPDSFLEEEDMFWSSKMYERILLHNQSN